MYVCILYIYIYIYNILYIQFVYRFVAFVTITFFLIVLVGVLKNFVNKQTI